jgi:hypothetical protein
MLQLAIVPFVFAALTVPLLAQGEKAKAAPKPATKAASQGIREGGCVPPQDAWLAEWQAFAKHHPDAAKAIVARTDTDGDGKLGAGERKAAAAAMTQWRREHFEADWEHFVSEHPDAAKKVRAEADKDGDGTIDKAERQLAHERMQQARAACREKGKHAAEQHPEAAKKAKERVDGNDDGKVGARELHHARHEAHERRDERRTQRRED